MASPDVLVGDGYCVPFTADEALWSVSPEGHAWLARSVGALQQLRVLDPFDAQIAHGVELALAPFRQLQAWSPTDAALVTDDGLWRLEELARLEQASPADPTTISSMCGDPGSNGMLLAEGVLYERRGGSWWHWDAAAGSSAAPRSVIGLDGDCVDTEDVTWLVAADGTIWQLGSTRVDQLQQFEAGAAVAATSGIVAILESSRLSIRRGGWQAWGFDGAMPTLTSAAGGALWLAAGEQLLRTDGDEFFEVSHPLAEPITTVMAHAGGAWIVGENNICHVSTAPMLRVVGLRPHFRGAQSEYDLSLSASDGADVLSASVDGEAIALHLDDDTGELVGRLRLDRIGWNALSVESAGTVRTVPVKRLPAVVRSWDEDIAPVYEQHCTGSDCHGSSADAPDLSSYAAWVSRADEVRVRVVEAATMPPAFAQGPDWGETHVLSIAEWLEGGMLP